MNKNKYFIASFDKLKLNYITIAKTGSTSVLYALHKASGDVYPIGKGPDSHLHNTRITDYISLTEAKDNGYKNFTVTREPVARACSMFYDFMFKRFGIGGGGGSIDFLNEFNRVRTTKNFYEIFSLVNRYKDVDRGKHFRTQSYYHILEDLINIKLEHINKISIIHPDIKVENRLNSNDPKLDLSKKELDLIHSIYKKDFNLWEGSI